MPEIESNFLSDEDIAFLCDIGEFELPEGSEHTAQLRRLIAAGFIESTNAGQAPAKFQLTARAEQFLCERGVGLNEA